MKTKKQAGFFKSIKPFWHNLPYDNSLYKPIYFETANNGILSDPPSPKEPFLEIDKVLHDSVALPNLGFTAQISVNYRLPDPTLIWLVAKEKGSFEVLGGRNSNDIGRRRSFILNAEHGSSRKL